MLKFNLDGDLLPRSLHRYLNETYRGTRTASRVEMVWRIWADHAKRFNALQPINLTSAVPDGCISTLANGILDPLERNEPPKLTGALLHGLLVHPIEHLAYRPCRPGGRTWYHLDPESYVTRIQLSTYKDIVGIVAYLHLVRTMHLVWLGRMEDFLDGMTGIQSLTRRMSDWAWLDRRFQQRLNDRCQGT